MKVLNPTSGFPAWGSDKGTGNPQGSGLEGQWDLIIGLSEDWGKQRLQSWRTQTKPSERQDSEERSNDPRRLNQNYLLVLEGLLWRCGSGGARHRARALAATVWECPPWHKPSWRLPLTGPQPTGWVTSGQKATRGGVKPHHCQIIGLKLYWARSCQTEQDPVFPALFPPIREAYTSLLASTIKEHTVEARRTKILQLEQKSQYRNLISMKKQKVMSQMKGQDKNPRKTTKWSGDRQLSRKRI